MRKVTPIGGRKTPQPGDGPAAVGPGKDGSAGGEPDAVGKGQKVKKTRREHADAQWLENRVRALYAEVVEEPLPPDLARLVKEIERKKH